jgi:hypothetical protein
MAKKKNKNNPIVNIEVDTDGDGPPADPDVPDLPTPKINVHVSNANANANVNAVGGGGGAKTQHLVHDHNHHHSHYARSVDRDSAGREKVTERKEVVDVYDAGEGTKTKTVKETTSGNKVSTVKAVSSLGRATSIHPPSSPAKSVKSLHQPTPPHQPDIIVNITLPQTVPALDPIPSMPAPVTRPPSIAPATIPLPQSLPPSPTPTVRSLPAAKAKSVKNVVAVPIPEEDEVEEEVTVTMTTRKIRKTPSPPVAAALPLPMPPSYVAPGTPLVIADPTWKPEPDPRPTTTSRPPSIMARHKGKDHGFVETTVVETVTHPAKEKSSFFDKFKLPKFVKPTDTGPGGSPPPGPAGDNHIQVRIHPGGDVDVDIDKHAANPHYAGAVFGNQSNQKVPIKTSAQEPTGTKAGIRTIPISEYTRERMHMSGADHPVDYKALITQTPPRRQPSLPSVDLHPAAPKTILTMSADIERDSNGDPHYKARVRDHTGVKKVDKVIHKKSSNEKAQTHKPGHGGVDVHVPGVDVHIDTPGSDSDSESEVVEAKKERKARKEREKREKRKAAAPLYRPLNGAYPAPLSER